MTQKQGAALIAQGGGPTPVINNSVYGVHRELRRHFQDSATIWGAQRGILGLLEDRLFDLYLVSDDTWSDIARSPGSILRSCRKKLSDEESDKVIRILKDKDIRYFFYIGGNDSMDTAFKLSTAAASLDYELFVAGIPKTIDNDLPKTDHCPGYGSAARFIAQSFIDLGNDVFSLPTPVSIMEVMGRNTGWLTASSILARKRPDDAPHLIYLPEFPFSKERFIADVQAVVEQQGWAVVSVCEGLKDESGNPIGLQREQTARDGFGHPMQGDVSSALAGLIRNETGLRARSEKPGLCGRSSALLRSTVDATEAHEVGKEAARRTLEGETNFMVTIERKPGATYQVEYGAVALSQVANVERLLPASFVTEERNNVREDFREYVEPLIGGCLQHYPRLFH